MSAPQIYTQDYSKVVYDLLPPPRRQSVMLAWLDVLMTPIQWLRDLIFGDYYDGSTASDWAAGAYTTEDRVIYLDGKVYEALNTFTSVDAPNIDTTNWIPVLDTFVGLGERVKYTGQLIYLEYILNKHFRVSPYALPFTGADQVTQIYIVKQTTYNNISWMAQSSSNEPNMYMANNSQFSDSWMPTTPATIQICSFIVSVPNDVKVAIEANLALLQTSDTFETVIRTVVDKYVRAGKEYQVNYYI